MSAAPAETVVRQLGPAIGSQGGIASVLAAYQRLPLRRHRLRFISTWHPDAPAWSAGLFAAALRRLLTDGRPRSVAHLHLSEGGSFVREGFLAVVAGALGAPVVVSLHGADFAPFLRRHPRLVRRVLRRADAVVALGPATAALVAPLLRPSTEIAVIPNPVEVPPTWTPAGERDETVLFAGVNGRRKGLDTLLVAWPAVRAAHPAARLLVAGPPGDVTPVTVEGIDWLGPLAHDRLLALLDTVRVIVLPSRAEVMPMTLLEAMARARPVIATPVGEVPTLVGDDQLLVDVDDPVALAAALQQLLADPGEATRRGLAGRRRVQERFSAERVAAQLEALYRSLQTG